MAELKSFKIELDLIEIANSNLAEMTKHEFIEWLIAVGGLDKKYWRSFAEIIHKDSENL